MLKRIISLLLVFGLLFSVSVFPVSAEDKKLTFNQNGKFRIMQINDFQDRDNTNADTLAFLNKALDLYKPDLVVLVGDQIHHSFPGVTVEKIKTTIRNQLMPIEERGIPFIFTFGNHDRDYNSLYPMEEQAAFYREFSMCYANTNGPDGGTYSTLIYGKDGKTPALNIYMMDTNHWNGTGWTSGVNENQVKWYSETNQAIRQSNGGKIVPSLVFQHIPVKEIHSFLKVVPADTEGAVKSLFYNEYYVLDENADWVGDRNVMREAPACEHPEKVTGQYEAWLEQGDIIGAYFGHEHINTFVGRTEDGIVMGYNGGFGFAAYGDPGERYARIYDFTEGDVGNYNQETIYYTKCMAADITEEPEVSDEPKADCSCNCHESGFVGFLWKIINFFNRLFKMNPVCECGVKHY